MGATKPVGVAELLLAAGLLGRVLDGVPAGDVVAGGWLDATTTGAADDGFDTEGAVVTPVDAAGTTVLTPLEGATVGFTLPRG